MNTIVTNCPGCDHESIAAPLHRLSGDIVQCPKCSLVYLRTRPDALQTYNYYQQYADDHSHMRLPRSMDEVKSSVLRRDYFLDEITKLVPACGNILDIGCGWGAFLDNARDKGFVPFGVELCKKAADYASKTAINIPVQQGKIEEAWFGVESFGVVSMIHSLEHLPDTSIAIQAVKRWLKPGGLFCGIVPNIESFCSDIMLEDWNWLDSNTHYVHFSCYTIMALLKKHGFQIAKIETHTGDYDQSQLRTLVQLESRKVQKEGGQKRSVEDVISSLWKDGFGEEIRFFAFKP